MRDESRSQKTLAYNRAKAAAQDRARTYFRAGEEAERSRILALIEEAKGDATLSAWAPPYVVRNVFNRLKAKIEALP